MVRFLTLLVSVIMIFFWVSSVSAVNMDSAQFRIKEGNVNIGAQDHDSDNYHITTTLGQTAANEFASAGYMVKAGFQYIHSIIPFRFIVSSTNISLGTLLANSPATASTTLKVSFGLSGQYIVTAAELHPLNTLSLNSIPDTTCDGGINTCTASSAKVWTSSSAYGFGYNMTGDDIPADFIDSTYYRPFADLSAAASPQTVMSNTNVTLDALSTPRNSNQSTMTFKGNISSVQPGGTYQTIISFIATPSY